jgi:phage-related protein
MLYAQTYTSSIASMYLTWYTVSVPEKILHAVFFRQLSSREPVREWLKDKLEPEDRRVIGMDIATVEWGWPVGMPGCRSLGQGLREVRSSLPGGRIARVVFCLRGDRMILLAGFLKTSSKTPAIEINKALKRMKEIDHV